MPEAQIHPDYSTASCLGCGACTTCLDLGWLGHAPTCIFNKE